MTHTYFIAQRLQATSYKASYANFGFLVFATFSYNYYYNYSYIRISTYYYSTAALSPSIKTLSFVLILTHFWMFLYL